MVLSRLLRSSQAARAARRLTAGFDQLQAASATCVGASGTSESHARFPVWPLALGVLAGSAALVQEAHQDAREEEVEENPRQKAGFHLLDASTRLRTFYKYERRIRDFSQPDKVFHYFASRTLPDGTRVMSANDLIRAVVAVFPPENSDDARSGGLAGEPARPAAKKQRKLHADTPKDCRFLSAFDSGNDGISFSEYLLLLTFLKIPAQMFDVNGDGNIHLPEFEEITDALQQRLKRVSTMQRTGAHISQEDSSQGLKSTFFGANGKGSLSLKDFSTFISGMHEELLRLEFEHYDVDQDETITGRDFAHSILSSVDLATIDTYLHRAASLPDELANIKVSYDEFKHFASLYQHVHALSVALDFYHNINGKLEHSDFKRASKIVTGNEVSDNLVKIVYTLFDLNGDGNLSSSELIAVLRKREGSRSNKRSDEDETIGLFSCLYACAFDR